MATKKKMLEAAAGGAGGAGLDITDVFSTQLYTGNATARSITTAIDLAGEGGMVWTKSRNNAALDHYLTDSSIGDDYYLSSNTTGAAIGSYGTSRLNFTSTGYDLGVNSGTNSNNDTYASWTFRKAPKFFDVVTYTGNGSGPRAINHNLGTTVGSYFIKRLDSSSMPWVVYHRGVDATDPEDYILALNATTARVADNWLGNTAPTDTQFYVGSTPAVNNSGSTYVAYLFAHNDSGDGEFGPDGDQDIIKCGSYTGNGNYTTGNEVDVGFEPQWVMIKNASRTDGNSDWVMYDTMRGFTATNEVQPGLFANLSDVETASGGKSYQSFITTSGFTLMDSNEAINYNGDTYIYMAIRRGPLASPEAGTEVFAVAPRTNTIPGFASGFPVDFLIGPRNLSGDNNEVKTRLISGGYLRTNTTGAENASSQAANFAHNDGFFNFSGANAGQYSWMWKRAPGFFDAVAYSGSTSIQNISHNLGVQPEMIWIKNRTWTGSWTVLFTSLGARKYLSLETADGAVALPLSSGADFFANTLPTSSVFTVGGGTAGGKYDNVGSSGLNYIAYLFATLAGVSKVGSVTHSGTTNVDCGFSAGARFVLLKRTDATGDWYLWDSVRGIIAGNDPYLLLNSTAAQVTNTDYIDPLSSGFTITSTFTAGDYIFYAIA